MRLVGVLLEPLVGLGPGAARDAERQMSVWRISIIEVLGWMIIVAVITLPLHFLTGYALRGSFTPISEIDPSSPCHFVGQFDVADLAKSPVNLGGAPTGLLSIFAFDEYDTFGISVMGAQNVVVARRAYESLVRSGIEPRRIYVGGQGAELPRPRRLGAGAAGVRPQP